MKGSALNNHKISDRFYHKKRIYLFFCLCLVITVISSEITFAQNTDSVLNPDNLKFSKYLSPEKFTYAGERRYTLDGLLPNLKTELRPVKAIIFGGIYLGAITGLHIHQANAWWSKDRGKFHFVGVKKEARGLGIGTCMNHYMLQEMKKRGYHTIEIGWIDEQNTAERKATEKIGATLSKIYRVYAISF